MTTRPRRTQRPRRPKRVFGTAATLSFAMHGLVLAAASVLLAGKVALPTPSEGPVSIVVNLAPRPRPEVLELPRIVRAPIPEVIETTLDRIEAPSNELFADAPPSREPDPEARPRRDADVSKEVGAQRGLVPARRARGASAGVGASASGDPAGQGLAGAGTGTGEAQPPSGRPTEEATGQGGGPPIAARLVESVRPTYPPSARRRSEEGVVSCRIHVRIDGTVEEVEVVRSSGSERLDEAAVSALMKWKFEPATWLGVARPSVVNQDVRFSLNQA